MESQPPRNVVNVVESQDHENGEEAAKGGGAKGMPTHQWSRPSAAAAGKDAGAFF